MFNNFRTVARSALLSAMVGLGTLAAVPAAQADGLYLNYGGRNNAEFGLHVGEHRHGVRNWHRACTPQRALSKAKRMGLWRARVVDVGRHTIKVAGRKYNERVVVVFGRDRSCPVIYR
jgi:hypothetical protein